MTGRSLPSLVLAFLLGAPAAPAEAEPIPGGVDASELALEKGHDAVTLFEQGKWGPSLSLFRDAEQLYHSPVFVFYAARCEEKLGKLLDARVHYRSVVEENLGEDAPPIWRKAQADSVTALAALTREIPTLTVEVRGASAPTRVTIDGEAVRPDAIVELDPGVHRVEVSDGARAQARESTLERGQPLERIRFDVEPAPIAEPQRAKGWTVLGAVLTTTGGLGLVGGAVLGALAVDRAASANAALPSTCTPTRSCPDFEASRIDPTYDAAFTFAAGADALLIGGGITAAAGIVILIVDSQSGARTASPLRATARGIELRF